MEFQDVAHFIGHMSKLVLPVLGKILLIQGQRMGTVSWNMCTRSFLSLSHPAPHCYFTVLDYFPRTWLFHL